MKKIINPLKKFFKRRGMAVEILPLRKVTEFTHTISFLSSNSKKNMQQFIHTVECVFPKHHKLRDDCFEIAIHEEFIICTECGCSNMNACLGGCYWVAPTLCSSCHKPEKKVRTKSKLHKLLEA